MCVACILVFFVGFCCCFVYKNMNFYSELFLLLCVGLCGICECVCVCVWLFPPHLVTFLSSQNVTSVFILYTKRNTHPPLHFIIVCVVFNESVTETNKVKKQCSLIRQYNIQIFYKIIFFKYRTRQIKTTETNKKVTYLN